MMAFKAAWRSVIAATAGFAFCTSPALPESLDLDTEIAWKHLQASIVAQERLLSLAQEYRPRDALITNVTIVDPLTGETKPKSHVLVRQGKVEYITNAAAASLPSNAQVIDGKGKYLFPGLTDMHVHTHDEADYLLQLSYGITTIREMNGWKFRLARRDAVDRGELLAPNMYVVSRIVNSSDFGGYATPIQNADEARAAVRRLAAEGYANIKIHNGISNEEFHAIMDEANSIGIKVVGHIPVQVSVEEAIAAGFHTAEHFKGYIDDSTLEISEGDWLTPSKGMEMFLTPTFYSYREHLIGAEAQDIIDRSAYMVPPHRRLIWQERTHKDLDGLAELRQSIRPKSELIFSQLRPLGIKWLAGTDSGGYELMVPGEALIEELEIMESLGLPTLEALQAATTTAAEAMNWTGKTGRIAPGYSADLILLNDNPLQTVSNLRSLESVMIRGIWISDPSSIRPGVQDYQSITSAPTPASLEAAIESLEELTRSGFAQFPMSIRIWSNLAERLSEPQLAARLRALSDE